MRVLLDEHIYQIKVELNRAIGILSKLRSHVNLNTLRIVYYLLFHSHLQYGVHLLGHKNKKIKEIMQKLQNCALRHIYKDHKILRFTDIPNV